LMESGSTIEDLARTVHTDLAEGILYGVDARDGLHLPRNYIIKDRDILSIVSGKKRRKSATRSERR
jgi:ribosome-interacting GTPase 1